MLTWSPTFLQRGFKGALLLSEKLRRSIAEVRVQITVAKDALADAYRELKSYEVAHANR